MKLCSKCKELKELDGFHKNRKCKDQRCKYCKVCASKERMKLYYKGKVQGNCTKCGKKNLTNGVHCGKCTENRRLRGIEYRKNPEYKDRMKQYESNRKKTDIQFKLKHILRSRIRIALKNNYKSGSAVNDLGCSIKELIVHLESQFVEGMTWTNHGNGKGEWNIDHIIPLSTVDLSDREQFLKVCHYTNLRPLWAIDNIRRRFDKNVIMGEYS